jgi:hypothetical protein
MKTVLVSGRAILGCFIPVLLGWCNILAQSSGGSGSCTSPIDSNAYTRFDVLYGATYKQVSAAGATPASARSFGLAATVTLATNATASAASVTIPGQASRAMVQTQPGHFLFSVATNSFAELTAAYPGGDFTFDVLNSSTTISLPDGTSLPNPPTLINYDADQSIDPTKDFNLAWTPFSGGTSKDFITVTITDSSSATVLQTASSGCPSSLNGTASSVLIPANTLSANQTYQANLVFAHVVTLDIPPQPGAILISGSEAITQATIATGAGGGGPPPSSLVLTNAAWLPNGRFRFDLTATPGTSYTIQFNPRVQGRDKADFSTTRTCCASGPLHPGPATRRSPAWPARTAGIKRRTGIPGAASDS